LQLTEQDRAIAAAIAQAHPMEPANDRGRLFHVLITFPGGVHGFQHRAVDSTEAAIAANEWLGARGLEGKVEVRPDVQTSYMHGRLRYPEQLHAEANEEAWRGWSDAHDAALLEADRINHLRKVSGERERERIERAHFLELQQPRRMGEAF
jgi:hypothetical protein